MGVRPADEHALHSEDQAAPHRGPRKLRRAYSPEDRGRRVDSERFRCFSYDELVARDKANLDITWLRDESLDDAASLPSPGVLAAAIVEELEAALAQFAELAASLPIDLTGK